MLNQRQNAYEAVGQPGDKYPLPCTELNVTKPYSAMLCWWHSKGNLCSMARLAMAGQQTRQQEYFHVRPTQEVINIKVPLLAAEEIGDLV